MWDYPFLYAPSSAQWCQPHTVQSFSTDLDQSAWPWDRSIGEEKGENKSIKKCCLTEEECVTLRKMVVCGVLTVVMWMAGEIPLTKQKQLLSFQTWCYVGPCGTSPALGWSALSTKSNLYIWSLQYPPISRCRPSKSHT